MNTTNPSLLDKSFVYIPANRTNVAETWKKYGYTPPSEQKVVEEEKK